MIYKTSNFESVVLITIGICGQVNKKAFMVALTKEPFNYKKKYVSNSICKMQSEGLIKTYTPRSEEGGTKMLRLLYPKGDEAMYKILPDLYEQFIKMDGGLRGGVNEAARKRHTNISRLVYAFLQIGIPVDRNQIIYQKSDFVKVSQVECKIMSDDLKETYGFLPKDEPNFLTKAIAKNIEMRPIGVRTNIASNFVGLVIKKPKTFICYLQTEKNKKWNSTERIAKFAIARKTQNEGAVFSAPSAILYADNMSIYENIICEPPRVTKKTGPLNRQYNKESVFVVPMEHFKTVTNLILRGDEEEKIKEIPELKGKKIASLLTCELNKLDKLKKDKEVTIVCYKWQAKIFNKYFGKERIYEIGAL